MQSMNAAIAQVAQVQVMRGLIYDSFYSSKLHSNNFFLPASKLVPPNYYLQCYQPSCYQGLFFQFEDVVAT